MRSDMDPFPLWSGGAVGQLHFQVDRDIFANQQAASFQRRVPRQAEILAMDLGGRRGASLYIAPRILHFGSRPLDMQHYLLGDAMDGHVAFYEIFAIPMRLDTLAHEFDS